MQVSYANSMAQLIYGLPLADDLTSYGMVVGYYGSSASTTQGLLYCSSNGSGWNVASAVQLGTGSLGTVGQWVHMAMVRSGSDWSYYVDGTRTYTGSLGSATISTPGSYMYLGRAWGDVSSMEAYYDDFRVTQGLARYTGASFTPPTTAHLTSAGDVNKQIVVNSDADGVAIGTGGINQARIAKAWVNFNGTSTVAIRESYNISSLADRGTGLYSLNLSTALSSVECAGAGSATDQDTGTDSTQRNRMVTIIPESTSLVYVNGFDTSGNADDVAIATAIIFGN